MQLRETMETSLCFRYGGIGEDIRLSEKPDPNERAKLEGDIDINKIGLEYRSYLKIYPFQSTYFVVISGIIRHHGKPYPGKQYTI